MVLVVFEVKINYFQQVLFFVVDRFEMQDAGITQDISMKNFSLVPYFLHSSQSDEALSVPA